MERIDTSRRYVRITGHRTDDRGDDFVEFEFAVGEPELFVEMILPTDAFEDFCRDNGVERLPDTAGAGDADDPFSWRLHDATHAVTEGTADGAGREDRDRP